MALLNIVSSLPLEIGVPATITAFFLLYTLYSLVYRLYLSPLAKFPGPKLAGATYWYEFYFDVVKRGQYVWEIKKMHEKYGNIVRINPDELHINDHKFVTQLYPSVAKNVEKPKWSAGMFGSNDMAFGTIAHETHRLRRNAFNAFFSKASVRRLEPTIQQIIENLCAKVREYQALGNPMNVVHAYSALTHDIITEYCFADCKNALFEPDFDQASYNLIQEPAELSHTIKQFPYMIPIMDQFPNWFVRTINPLAGYLRAQRDNYGKHISSILSSQGKADHGNAAHATVFHSLVEDPRLPSSEKQLSRLVTEAQSLVGAGTLTTAHMLSSTTYYILADPAILQKLLAELNSQIPDPAVMPTLAQLEDFPFLTAVIYEGLRISYGTLHRLSRVHPEKALRYHDWCIPPGTAVGITSLFIHDEPSIFPEPRAFHPERWLGSDAKEKTKYLFNFGKGTRQCVGINLAYAEIYLTLAVVFRQFGNTMRLFDTEVERDVDVAHDFFVTAPRMDSKGIRVVVGKY